MITLTRKLKKDPSAVQNECAKRATIRDRLLVKEAQELEQNLPSTCKVYFSDPNVLSEFTLTITPDEGFWKDGKFKFTLYVPEEYNMTVSYTQSTLHNSHENSSNYSPFQFDSHLKWNVWPSYGIRIYLWRVTFVCHCYGKIQSMVWAGFRHEHSRMSFGG